MANPKKNAKKTLKFLYNSPLTRTVYEFSLRTRRLSQYCKRFVNYPEINAFYSLVIKSIYILFYMISSTTRSKIFNRISVSIVLLALITLTLIQYKWVTSSAEKDLVEFYRSYSFRIQGSISEQFSLFPIFGDRLKFIRGLKTEEELRKKLLNYLDTDISGDNLKYLKSISYLKVSDEKREFFVYSNREWHMDKKAPDLQLEDEPRLNLISDPTDNGKVWLTIPLPPFEKSRISLLIQFDILSFYQNEIEPSVWNENNMYELKWYYNSKEELQSFNEKEYSYSPFRVLKDKLLSTHRPWLIEIPLHVIIFNDQENKMSKIFFDHKTPPGIGGPPSMVYVDLLYNGQPLIETKEYNLTVQWLISLSLILGLAIAYIVILYQINSLKILRMREKEFVASVTHELRTPLTVIHSAADNMKSGIISPERIEQYGQLITNQSKRLSSMIEGILLFSRLEGKAEHVSQTDRVIFSHMQKNLSIYAESLEQEFNKKISLDFGSLPKEALTDRETLELILTNLISNSSKHAYARDLKSDIRVTGHIKLPHTLIFIVEDDGIGIEKSEIKHIFEPFFRGEKSLKNQIKGSGLGLYLSFRKARLMGGLLKVHSPYERVDGKIRTGCRFTLTVPYYSVDDKELS